MTAETRSATLTRRHFTLGAAGAVLLALPASRALASATPTPDDLGSPGYPALDVTITDTGFDGLPASLTGGRYLLQATNKIVKDGGNGGAVAFLSPTPAGLTADGFLQLLAANAGPPPGATPVGGGTPTAGDQGGGNQQIPLVVYQMHFAGGVNTLAGATAEAVIDLTAGEWIVWGDDPTAPQKPVVLKVTGDAPEAAPEPAADLTATLVDFGITVEGNLTAGKHMLKVQHHGAQPHFLVIQKGPDTLTKEQAVAAIMADPSATPAPGALSEKDFQQVFYSPTQSIGTVTYQHIELAAGTYLAACFFPTAGTGVPHAFNGMIDVFKVTG